MADPFFKDLAFAALAQTARNPTRDFLQATPRNPILGYLSDLAASSYSPERTQQMQGVAKFMSAPAISETLDRLSYGEPLTTGAGGLGGTTRVRPEALEAAMAVAPMVAPAARATRGLPVGMGIKSVRDDIFNLSKQEFLGKPRITKNANAADLKPIELNTLKDVEPQPFMGGKYQIKMNEDGAVVLDKDKPIASYNFGDTLVVDKPYRKSGIAQELVYEWRTSFPAPAVAKERTKASQVIQEKVWERIQNEKQSLPQPSPYPQQAALDLAQQRAALPIEQGGLGLPVGNTAMDRAAAMGFDTDAYHGTTNDFNKFAGRLPTYAAEEPRIADIYANATRRHMALSNINAGPNIIPLKLGGKEFTVSDLGEGGGGWFSDNLAQALGIPRTRTLINELPKYGIDRLKVTDMGDIGGVQTQHMIPSGSDNIRSRFAAFDPFRRSAAIAATMGVAAPDLMAAPIGGIGLGAGMQNNQRQPAVQQAMNEFEQSLINFMATPTK